MTTDQKKHFAKERHAQIQVAFLENQKLRCINQISEQLLVPSFGGRKLDNVAPFAFVCGHNGSIVDDPNDGDEIWDWEDNLGNADFRCCYSESGADTACSPKDTTTSWCVSMTDRRDPPTVCEFTTANTKLCTLDVADFPFSPEGATDGDSEPGSFGDPHFKTFGDEWFGKRCLYF